MFLLHVVFSDIFFFLLHHFSSRLRAVRTRCCCRIFFSYFFFCYRKLFVLCQCFDVVWVSGWLYATTVIVGCSSLCGIYLQVLHGSTWLGAALLSSHNLLHADGLITRRNGRRTRQRLSRTPTVCCFGYSWTNLAALRPLCGSIWYVAYMALHYKINNNTAEAAVYVKAANITAPNAIIIWYLIFGEVSHLTAQNENGSIYKVDGGGSASRTTIHKRNETLGGMEKQKRVYSLDSCSQLLRLFIKMGFITHTHNARCYHHRRRRPGRSVQ